MKLVLLCLIFSASAFPRGHLLLIGGGNRSQEILKEMVRLAGGEILIVPLASSIPDEVAASAKRQLEAVGGLVSVFSCSTESVDRPICLMEIRNARLIYFTGGSQNQLLSAFAGSRALELLRRRFESDLHLAGTSAGTAVMSEIMITGNPLPPHDRLEGVRPGMVETIRGLGFIRKFIIDQHFLKRSRQDRLLSAVLDSEVRLGVGIDESTAILVDETESFRVIGDSFVMVMDARNATVNISPEGTYVYQNISTSLLAPGTSFRLP